MTATATLDHTPKATRLLSSRRIGDLLVVRLTLRYKHGTQTKTYSVLECPDREGVEWAFSVVYSFARRDEHSRNLYRTVYSPQSDKTQCNCDARRHQDWCCHGDALRALYHAGRLPSHDPSF
jgi:hypothetical protein